MNVRTASVLPVLCVALAAQTVTVTGTVKTVEAGKAATTAPVSPMSESITLSTKAPAGVTAPAGLTDAHFGQMTMGGKTVNFVVGKSTAGAENADVLYADLDGNGSMADGEKIALEVTPLPTRNNQPSPGARSKQVDVTFTVGGNPNTAKVAYMVMGKADPMVSVSFASYLEGKLKIGDTEHIVAIVDKDLDGRFDSAKDLWTLGKEGGKPETAYGMSGVGEKRFEGGNLVGIKVDGTTIKATIAEAKGPEASDLAAHRVRVEHLWSDRFDKEREQFVADRKMDTKRAKAKTPIAWNYVSFDEAIALGKKANKPVFIDVMAFWCVWCYRMDYYTYCDAQVAEVLSTKFVPCKIIQEQAKAGDYDMLMKEKLKARGIPAMGVFGADGEVKHTIGGWKKPEDFLTELDTALNGKKPEAAPPADKEENK